MTYNTVHLSVLQNMSNTGSLFTAKFWSHIPQ